MQVTKFDAEIEHNHSVIATNEEALALIKAEIDKLKVKLDSLTKERYELRSENEKLNKRNNDLAREKENWLLEQQKQLEIEKTAETVYNILANTEGWAKAHDYQKADITSAVHAYLSGFTGFINANDMGLGKTMESLLTLKVLSYLFDSEFGRKPRIIWLTKSSILKTGGTKREADRWYPEMTLVPLDGSLPKDQREFMFDMIKRLDDAVVITNYETVRTTENLREINWDFIVMDEVHKLKGGANLNGPTKLWKAVKGITENARMILMLSGTPMVNRPAEMWAYLHIFDPDRFPRMRDFENFFSMYDPRTGGYIINPDKLLREALYGRMCLRKKTDEEVKLDLPDITPYEDRERLVEMLPNQRSVYNQMRDRFFIWLEDQESDQLLSASAIIAQITRLRQINIWPVINFTNPETGEVTRLEVRESSKIDELMDIVEEAQDQVVVFCTFNEPFNEIKRRCEEMKLKCGIISGENSKDLSTLEVDFQQGKIDVLCINSAMGEGLNLQKNPEMWPGGSSTVVFLDLWWNSARNNQCTDRVYRQGASERVNVIHIKNEQSIDSFMDMIIEGKDLEIGKITSSSSLRPAEWKSMLKKAM